MIDYVKLFPESFATIYLRQEDRTILLTESGRKIFIKRIIPTQWTPYRIYEYENAINENKRNIKLIDKKYLRQIERELREKIEG